MHLSEYVEVITQYKQQHDADEYHRTAELVHKLFAYFTCSPLSKLKTNT